MTFVFDVNTITSLTGPQAMFKMKELMKSAGWTVKSSGDATSYFSTTDGITSGSSGAGGLANNSAWFRIQAPDGYGGREFTVQRGTTNVLWTIRYSFNQGFIGGAPSATVTPTATDQQVVLNNATLFATDNQYRMIAAANNSDGYAFYMACFPNGGASSSVSGGAWMMDIMAPGTFPSADVDPSIHYTAGGSAWAATTTLGVLGYLKKGLVGEGFVNIAWQQMSTSNQTLFPRGVANNNYNQKTDLIPILYARKSTLVAPVGYKGISNMIRWCGNVVATGTLITVNSLKDFVIIADVALPWNGSDILL